MEGHRKFLGEGVLKGKIFEAKYEAKLEFPRGRGGGAKQKTFRGGSMDIFWNCTLLQKVLQTTLSGGTWSVNE